MSNSMGFRGVGQKPKFTLAQVVEAFVLGVCVGISIVLLVRA